MNPVVYTVPMVLMIRPCILGTEGKRNSLFSYARTEDLLVD